MVNQSLTSQTYWLIDHSKPLWPVNEFVPNLDKKYEISPIFQLEIVSKIKILTMSAIMPAQNLKSKCPFGIYVAKWFTNSLGVSDYSLSRNEIFDRSIDQSTSQLSKLTGQPSVKSNAPSPRPRVVLPLACSLRKCKLQIWCRAELYKRGPGSAYHRHSSSRNDNSAYV